MLRAAEVRDAAKVPIVELDIGGGFPAVYGSDPRRPASAMPPLPDLMRSVLASVEQARLFRARRWWPRAVVIVARAFSVIVRVMLKKGQRLYINDGIWSSLSDSWTGKLLLPVNTFPTPPPSPQMATRPRWCRSASMAPRATAWTCSPALLLPETVDTGDWIEVGHIGANSLALRTRFNGFYPDTFVEVQEPFVAPEVHVAAHEHSRGTILRRRGRTHAGRM